MNNHNVPQNELELAAEAIDQEASICAEWDELVTSRDTLADFIAAQGEPRHSNKAENGMTVYSWYIGKRILAVVDLGEIRASLLM